MKLVNATQLDNDLTDIADLLRSKTGTTADLAFPNDFVTQVGKTTTIDEFASAGSISGPVYLNSATSIAAFSFMHMPITEIHAPNLTSFYSANSNETSYTGRCVFYNCQNLTVVDLPNFSSVGAGGYQFAKCTALTTVNLPKAAPGQYMFYQCTGLVTARLGGTGTMNGACFNGCTNLTGADLAVSATKQNEFNGCSKLTTLILRRTAGVVSLNNINCFTNTPFASGKSGGTLYVPQALISNYTSATNWSTIIGYTNNQILPIEGSIYETQYIDGTMIGG